ncbi:MAG: glutamate 5-kinase [Gammaproteobacteria bacterium]|nr:glutamate 5-kinase [Gammaproteobacteria bacterium]
MINAERETELRSGLSGAKRVVVKIGSSLLTDQQTGLAIDRIQAWCAQIHRLLESGMQVLLVSSGAVAEGVVRLGWKQRPTSIHEQQAAAAVGQMGLVQAYEQAFSNHDRHTAMVLLTHEDLADRQRYLNARATLTRLLELGVIPVVNENDTVATDEIRFGDNDTLAALVANLLQADLLIILTDTDGLHEADPRRQTDAPLLSCVDVADSDLDVMAGHESGSLGRGGMVTKLAAARIAARAGAHTVIANGHTDDVLGRLFAGDGIGTLLVASMTPLDARKRWIAGQLKVKGEVELDAGAVTALQHSGVSLLPVGVVAVRGGFSRGDVVCCVDAKHRPVAQGLVNYSSAETAKILGANSEEIGERLGYSAEPELMHRDNLVVLSAADNRGPESGA